MRLKNTIKIKFFQGLIFISIFLLTMMANGIYEAVSLQEELKYQNTDTGFIRLKDNYNGEGRRISIIEFFNEPNSLKKMKDLYIDITTDDNFKYYEVLDQSINYLGKYKGNPSLTPGEEFINQKIDGNIITPLNSFQLGYKASNYLNMSDKVESGRYFSEEDYIVKEDMEIPTILGYSYSDDYNIGDTINCQYLSQDFNLKVIGFLKKDSQFSMEYEYFLDNTMIIPSLNVENDHFLKEEFTKILYSLKNNGYIAYDNDTEYNYLTRRISDIANNIDIDWGYSGRVENPFKDDPINISVQQSKIIKVFLWIVSIALLILIYILEKKKCNYINLNLNLSKKECLIEKTKLFGSTFIQITVFYIITCFILWIYFRSKSTYFILKDTQIRLFPIILLSFTIIAFINNFHMRKVVKEK